MKCKKCGGNAGFNKWELCKKCREKKCKKCGNTFSIRIDRDFCGTCSFAENKKAQKAGEDVEWA